MRSYRYCDVRERNPNSEMLRPAQGYRRSELLEGYHPAKRRGLPLIDLQQSWQLSGQGTI